MPNLDDLLKLVEKPVIPWGVMDEDGKIRPQEGSVVGGTFIGVGEASGGEYGSYPIIEVDTGDNVVQVHAFHTLLQSELRKAGLLDDYGNGANRSMIGGDVVMKYFGRVRNPRSGKEDMARYRVVATPPAIAMSESD
jgi:hypothetical protein